MKIQILIYTSFLFIFYSCQKEIEYKGDTEDSYLVVNGMMESDTTIQISLSKSKPAIGEQNTGASEITSGAILVLKDNTTGQSYTSNQVNTLGYYSFNTNAIAGHSYEISISHNDFLTCTSSASIPSAVVISSWDTLSTTNSDKQNLKQLEVNWNDPSEKNYYVLKLFAMDTVLNLTESVYLTLDENNEFNFEGGSAFSFNDELFNGKMKSMKFKFNPSFYFDNITGLYSGEKSYKLVLYNVTEEVYKYVVSTQKAVENNNNFFGEPVKVFTNIKNGLGIFGGINKSVVLIK